MAYEIIDIKGVLGIEEEERRNENKTLN